MPHVPRVGTVSLGPRFRALLLRSSGRSSSCRSSTRPWDDAAKQVRTHNARNVAPSPRRAASAVSATSMHFCFTQREPLWVRTRIHPGSIGRRSLSILRFRSHRTVGPIPWGEGPRRELEMLPTTTTRPPRNCASTSCERPGEWSLRGSGKSRGRSNAMCRARKGPGGRNVLAPTRMLECYVPWVDHLLCWKRLSP